MTERLLQFIWQFQYFNKSELLTVQGEPVTVLSPGMLNTNQGPDFTDARVRIGAATWVGTVELHLRTTDWNRHGHQHDGNYRNVIMHVVWQHDDVETPAPDNSLPLIELSGRVSTLLLERYTTLMNSGSVLPCSSLIGQVPGLTWKSWKDRLVTERLQEKTSRIFSCLEKNNYFWEETFWWMLARTFGTRVNADAFESMARSIPVTSLARHKNQLIQIESMLMGQAGLLEARFRDSYAQLLQKEYRFLRKKLGLRPSHQPVYFLRMRPVNFPTIRLAQLARLVHSSVHLFSRITETEKMEDVRKLFDVTANDYWHYHFRFDDESHFAEKRVGESMINSIMINAIVPMLFSFGSYHQLQHFKDRAMEWLDATSPENNSVTKVFTDLGVLNKSAADSQALMMLNQHYCYHRHCLSCAVGNAVLKNEQPGELLT